RIVAGVAINFHDPILCAEEMRGALVECFSLIGVADETGFLYGEIVQSAFRKLNEGISQILLLVIVCEASQRRRIRLDVMYEVARQAAHVISVVLAALPVVKVAITRVALETRFVRKRRRQFGRINSAAAIFGLSAGLNM